MTALLEKTYGLATVYGYAEDRHSITLRDDHGREVNLFDLALSRMRWEVIEDWQDDHHLDWTSLTVAAQNERLLALEAEGTETMGDDSPDLRREEALDGLIGFWDLTPLFQSQVDAEVRRRWEED